MVWTNSSSNRYRLWRDPERGLVAGVCAGIANYLGVEPIVVRAVAVMGLVFFFPPTIAAYVILAVVLPPKPRAFYASAEEEAFWRGVNTAPADTLGGLKAKFRDLEARLGEMESQVASGDLELHRKFRDLGR
ncbi:MAG TPA: envelope stress response membrane protein PspC [Stellaceae bacterium]|nr:envelope stress response membrane protein PspC [Stellaceae bacterium]